MDDKNNVLQILSDNIRNTDAISDIADADNELQSVILKQERYKADTEQRLYLVKLIMRIISGWLIAVMLILVLNNCLFHLSDPVLITLLGTTTATVIGLPAIVLRGFFQLMDQNTDIDKHSK